MTGDRSMLGARVDPDLKRLVDADPRDNQDVVSAALWDEFGGKRRSALEVRIEHKDRRISQIETEVSDLEKEKAAIERERESLKQQLEEMEDSTERYENDLDAVLDEKQSGDREGRIIPETLSDLAEQHGKDPEDVYEDIKDRAVEQGREMRTQMFVSPMNESDVEDGWITEIWGDDE